MKAALIEFGFDRSRVESLGEPKPDLLLRFGYEPIRIEIFTSVADLDFEAVWERRCIINADNLEIAFIDRDSLIRSKVAAGRPQDLADLEQLRHNPPA